MLGDLNTFEFTDDLAEILPGTGDDKVLGNLITEALEEDDAYSFIFQGNSQVLDHIFVTDGLLDHAEADIVHVNTDFAEEGALFASDHEPVVARFTFAEDDDGESGSMADAGDGAGDDQAGEDGPLGASAWDDLAGSGDGACYDAFLTLARMADAGEWQSLLAEAAAARADEEHGAAGGAVHGDDLMAA